MDNNLIKILMFLILLSFIQVPVFADLDLSYSSINTSPSSPTIYESNKLYRFNVTWQNISAPIDTVLFEWNGVNEVPMGSRTINADTTEFYIDKIDLPANESGWEYKWFANDTSNNSNSTGIQTYVINKIQTEINLTLNGNEGNMSCEQYDNITFVAQINVTGLDIILTSNYSGVEDANIDIINKTVNLTESEGLCCVTALYSGNLNYSSSNITYFFDTRGPQYSNNVTSDLTYALNKVYQFNITWTDATLNEVWFESNHTGTLLIYNSSTNPPVQNSSGVFWINLTGLYVGPTYTYKWYATDSLNTISNTSEINYVISLGSILDISGETSVFYPSATNVTCWSNNNQINNTKFKLYRVLVSTIPIDVNYTSHSWTDKQTSLGPGTWIYYCNITDSSLIGNYSNATSHNLTISPAETTPSPSPSAPTTPSPSGAISIQGLTSKLTVNAGESKSTTFSLKNTYDLSFYVNISISGISNTWYRLDKKTLVRVFGDSSETITLTFNIPEDAEAKDYTVRVNVSGGTNPKSTFTLTVNPPVEEEVTIEQPETLEATNQTANETAAAPTGLFPFNLIDARYVVLIVGVIACVLILIFRFRSNIGGFVSRGYKPKPIKEKRIEVKPKPEEKVIKKKTEKKKRRFPLSGLKLRLTLVKKKKEKK